MCVCVCGRQKAVICVYVSCKRSSITSLHLPQELQVKNNRGRLFCVTRRPGGLGYLLNGFTQTEVQASGDRLIKRANVWQNLPVSTFPFISEAFQEAAFLFFLSASC